MCGSGPRLTRGRLPGRRLYQARPVDRCRECSGRRLAFTSARAAVVYAGAAKPFVRAWKERGLRPFAAIGALFWPARTAAYQLPDESETALPRLELHFGVGIAYGQ